MKLTRRLHTMFMRNAVLGTISVLVVVVIYLFWLMTRNIVEPFNLQGMNGFEVLSVLDVWGYVQLAIILFIVIRLVMFLVHFINYWFRGE